MDIPARDSEGAPVPLGDILVVDDEMEIRSLLAEHLRAEGFAVRTATDGDQALVAIRSHPPDLVFLDVMMPGTNGLEVLRRVRRDAPGTAVVMLTSLEDEALARAMLRMGAFDYIEKPFDFSRLEQLARAALGRSARSRRESAP